MSLYLRNTKTDKLVELEFDSQKIKSVALFGSGFAFYKKMGRPLYVDNNKKSYSTSTWYADRLPLFWESFSLFINGWWLIETKETALVLNPLFYGVYIESLKEMSYDGSLSRMVNGKWIEM